MDWYKRPLGTTIFLSLVLAINWVPQVTVAETFSQSLANLEPQIEADQLFEKGVRSYKAKQYQEAISIYQKVLTLRRELSDAPGIARTLNAIGLCYYYLNEYRKAVDFYQQALQIFQASNVRDREASTLNNLGASYTSLGEYHRALEFYQKALHISTSINNYAELNKSLQNLGSNLYYLDKYHEALEYYQEALKYSQKMQDPLSEGIALHGIGIIHSALGDYSQAQSYYQKSLLILKNSNNLSRLGAVFNSIGFDARRQFQYKNAIKAYQHALNIYDKAGNRYEIGRTLNNLSVVYYHSKNYSKALISSKQAVLITKELNDRRFEGRALDSLGRIYHALKQDDKAISTYRQSLAISREIGDRDAERIVLSSIGDLFSEQNQPELAIIFYKQSVNVTESIRKGIQQLSKEQQASYVDTVSDTYRRLADLLLAQGRLAEAQRVLELLKIQELRDFTRSNPSEEQQEVALLELEKQILQQYGSLLTFGQKLYECDRSGQSCTALRDQLDQLTVAFNRDSDILVKELRERLAKDPAFLTADQLGGTASNVVTAQDATVLIYPLVLDTKLRLLLAVRAGEQGTVLRTVEVSNVGQQQLWKTVSRFRELLETPTSDLKELQQLGNQLYGWLIRPLETELNNKQVHRLVFALDRSTRYIPMAALFDRQSNQYLIQKYSISTILSAELTDTRDRLPPKVDQTSVLAMGVSKAISGFNALPNVADELRAIVRNPSSNSQGIYPGLELLNDNFDYSALRDNLKQRQILHIATHGKFEPSNPENSFILPGKGKPLTIEEIQNLQNYMRDVHLVVLSACQTAVGGPDESGIEIPGISFYFLKNRAKAVIASLWQVNDVSTSELMQQFYKSLASGKMTKAEALQKAQLTLLQGNSEASGSERGNFQLEQIQDGKPVVINRNLSHPYYWAPFILIGNSL